MAEPAFRSPPPLFQAVVLDPIRAFTKMEASGGIVLFGAAVLAFALANSPWQSDFHAFWETPIRVGVGGNGFEASLKLIIDDGLMAIFFFVVGMEIKRELVEGELRTFRQAVLPAIAALGGMLVPAGIYLAFNQGTEGAKGWAIPMATDIAFSIGCLTLLGKRVPHALLIFLTALAIFDDIGGILVIALFYGHGVSIDGLLWVLAAALAVFALNRLSVQNALLYAAGGAALWIAFHESGLHATLAGVALGLLVPAVTRRPVRKVLDEVRAHARATLELGDRLDTNDLLYVEDRLEEAIPPLQRFEHALHPWVAYTIMPLFALANSGVSLGEMSARDMLAPIFLGIVLGLFLGKQLGIFGFTFAALRAGIAVAPGGVGWGKLYGVSTVAGIGFTVALFISNLAFASVPHLLAEARLGVLVGSLVSGVVGMFLLRISPRRSTAVVPAT
jgi:Na+:H+ antiporter, NhaA family